MKKYQKKSIFDDHILLLTKESLNHLLRSYFKEVKVIKDDDDDDDDEWTARPVLYFKASNNNVEIDNGVSPIYEKKFL